MAPVPRMLEAAITLQLVLDENGEASVVAVLLILNALQQERVRHHGLLLAPGAQIPAGLRGGLCLRGGL